MQTETKVRFQVGTRVIATTGDFIGCVGTVTGTMYPDAEMPVVSVTFDETPQGYDSPRQIMTAAIVERVAEVHP